MSAPSDASRPLPAPAGLTPLPALAALGTGGLLSLMVLCNAEVGRHGGALAASLAPHGTGLVAALAVLLLWRHRGTAGGGAVPAWAYLGGLSGALTVMLTSATAITALGLSGTLALGLLGQVGFGLGADRWGWLGMPRRRATGRDLGALLLILAGSAILILGGGR
jgi:transporter family-2 protein